MPDPRFSAQAVFGRKTVTTTIPEQSYSVTFGAKTKDIAMFLSSHHSLSQSIVWESQKNPSV